MLLEVKGFEFGKYLLVPEEKTLLRNGKTVSLTPKAFKVLSILVENHGRLIERDQLLNTVWADSFVEEGNLTFTIQLLRKVLNDKTKKPRFIETVPKCGYRFIANVKEIYSETETKTILPESDTVAGAVAVPCAATVKRTLPGPRSSEHLVSFAVITLVSVSAILISVWFVQNRNVKTSSSVLNTPFSSQKLSTNGKVFHAVLLPDGRSVIYSNGRVGDKQSLWRRHLESGENIELIPPLDDWYGGLAVSPDGNTLYFTRRTGNSARQFDVYRVSIFGGIPQKIIAQTQGWISVSPDGKSISFVRCPYRDDEFCSLWAADTADGKNEKQLVVKPRPYRIGDNQFSSDGKTVAFAWGQSATASNEFGLSEVNLETGAERELTPEKFFNIKGIAWLPDKNTLLITASRAPNKRARIWQVSLPNGEALPLTNDSEIYGGLDIDAGAAKLVSTQAKQDFRVRLYNMKAPSNGSVLVDGSAVTFSSDGRLYFSSIMSGNEEIWSISPDGSGQRQLTNNIADDVAPIVSPDNNYVFFSSNRTGAAQVWRMNADGSEQTQITQTEGGAPLSVTPDGQWVYYRHGLTSTLWRASTKGGGEQIILDKKKSRFAISPDGGLAAFTEVREDERILTVFSLSDGKVLKEFRLADRSNFILHIGWMPDAKSLIYISCNRDYKNNTVWIQDTESEKPQKITDLGDEESVAEGYAMTVSPDGKTFAVVQGNWLHDAVLIEGLK